MATNRVAKVATSLTDNLSDPGQVVMTHGAPAKRKPVVKLWYQQFSAAVAKILSEEIEPLIDVRDRRLLGRELELSVRQEAFDQGMDFVLQLLSRATGDDEVNSSVTAQKCRHNAGTRTKNAKFLERVAPSTTD